MAHRPRMLHAILRPIATCFGLQAQESPLASSNPARTLGIYSSHRHNGNYFQKIKTMSDILLAHSPSGMTVYCQGCEQLSVHPNRASRTAPVRIRRVHCHCTFLILAIRIAGLAVYGKGQLMMTSVWPLGASQQHLRQRNTPSGTLTLPTLIPITTTSTELRSMRGSGPEKFVPYTRLIRGPDWA